MKRGDLIHIGLYLILIGVLVLKHFNLYPVFYKSILLIYILLMPGALLLFIITKKYYVTLHFLLYSIGLSIGIIEITGVLANFIFPLFHVSTPLSPPYILWSFILAISIIIILSWVTSRKWCSEFSIISTLPQVLSPSSINIILALTLMPLTTIVAVLILNRYGTTIYLYIAFLYLVLLAGMTLRLPPNTYPAVAFFMSLALLYHTSLVSGYLWGRDIFNEFYIVNLVIKHGKWMPSIINDPLNSALSITILPIYLSSILGISVVYVFKIIYPLVLAIASPVLYELYSTFFDKKLSILSVFLMIFSITYYAEIPQMARVMIAELFLSLFLLSLLSDHDYKLAVLFGIFLMISHYSTFYFIFFEILIVALLITIITRSPSKLELALVILFAILSLSWFRMTSKGFVLRVVIHYLIAIIQSILVLPKNLILGHNGIKTSPIHIATMKSPFLMQVTKLTYALIAGLFVIGVISSINPRKIRKIDRKHLPFYLLGVVNLNLMVALILIPPVARTITSTRVFHLVLFISSPFVLVGFNKVIQKIPQLERNYYKVTAIILIIFLILSSGILASFTKTPYDDTSIAFQPNSDWAKFSLGEVYAARWIITFWDETKVRFLYADTYGWVLPGAFNWLHCSQFPRRLKIVRESYIFLRSWNLKHRNILYGGGRITGGQYIPLSEISKYLENRIYNNGVSEIYLYIPFSYAEYSKIGGYCRVKYCITVL